MQILKPKHSISYTSPFKLTLHLKQYENAWGHRFSSAGRQEPIERRRRVFVLAGGGSPGSGCGALPLTQKGWRRKPPGWGSPPSRGSHSSGPPPRQFHLRLPLPRLTPFLSVLGNFPPRRGAGRCRERWRPRTGASALSPPGPRGQLVPPPGLRGERGQRRRRPACRGRGRLRLSARPRRGGRKTLRLAGGAPQAHPAVRRLPAEGARWERYAAAGGLLVPASRPALWEARRGGAGGGR